MRWWSFKWDVLLCYDMATVAHAAGRIMSDVIGSLDHMMCYDFSSLVLSFDVIYVVVFLYF